ncbi:DinB family protein [Labrys neptuniae]
MSGLIEHYREMARNNAYSNAHLLKACCQLSAEAFVAERVSFFPSLVATLNHILIVDRFYIAGLRGEVPDYHYFDDEIPFSQAAVLRVEQERSDRELIDLCDAWQAADLEREVRLDRGLRGVHVETIGSILPHLFVHQIHHRGQAHAMLAGTGVIPPQLDEFFLHNDRDLRHAAARDFGAKDG